VNAGRAAPGGAVPDPDLGRRLAEGLGRRAGALDLGPPPPPGPLLARARARQLRRRAAGGVAATLALVAAVVLASGHRAGGDPAAEEVRAGEGPPGQPETVARQWAPVPLRLGLAPGVPGAVVIERRDADWGPGARLADPSRPAGTVHQRLRPAFDRYEGPTIDLVALPGAPWPADRDETAPDEPLAGAVGRMWTLTDGRVRAAWRAGGDRTVTATAVGLPADAVRPILRSLVPGGDGRYEAPSLPDLIMVLDLSDRPPRGDTSRLTYRLGAGGTATIEVTLGDDDTFEDALGTDGGWRTVPVRGTAAARRGSEVRWYEATGDAVVRVAADDEATLDEALAGLVELTEERYQALAPGAAPTAAR
jgi:hypothetical protein